MGVFIFWLHYIIAFIFLYHILRCIYIKKETKMNYDKYYEITPEDKKLKHSLWAIILFIFFFIIPVWNILSLGFYIIYRSYNERGDVYNPYYIKSIFTKKY